MQCYNRLQLNKKQEKLLLSLLEMEIMDEPSLGLLENLDIKQLFICRKALRKKRLAAIQNEGAIAYMTNVNHDETVKMCDDLAKEKKWVMVQDTAWEGYEEIPLWIMQGYAGIAKEITEQLNLENAKPPTHIFLQTGVGSFAASIT